MSKTIERALRSATKFTDDIPAERSALLKERERLTHLCDALLPVEQKARTEITKQLDASTHRMNILNSAERLGGLPMLDQSIFAWTKPQQAWKKKFGWEVIDVPALAFVGVNDESCSLRVNWQRTFRFNGDEYHLNKKYLGEIVQSYQKIMDNLRRKYLSWSGRESITLTYTYPGVVPDHIKDIIREESETKRFKSLSFVCDANKWQIGVQMAPPEYADPILVGESGGALWVLASFDPTPIETYLLREFTS